MKFAAFLLASVAAMAQPAPAPAKSAFDKATLEAYLRNVELFLPQVTAKIDDAKPSTDLPGFFDVWVHWSANGAAKDELVYVSKDGKSIVRGDAFDVNKNPFQSNLDKLKTDLQPSFGQAGAPVVLVVFSDFQCPVCREESQILRQAVAKNFPDKVRVYFKDFPLESIHNWAKPAALAGRCVFKQTPAKFWDYFDWVYENQQLIGADNFSSKLQGFLSDKGLDGMQIGRCMENKTTEAEVNREIDEGHALQVSATPTIFLNGRKLEGSMPWETLQQLLNLEIEHQAKANDAGEKCCEVSLPQVGKKK
ncbi:MAG: thioredoxin domain-containing protein [Acidobacteriia bacterium]|nr:thioredoxin domain-containing protein [Terriglobia bacterium]